MTLTHTSHQLPVRGHRCAAGVSPPNGSEVLADDAPCPSVLSRIGMLDGRRSTTARPSGRKPHWAQRLAALVTKVGKKCGQRNINQPFSRIVAPARTVGIYAGILILGACATSQYQPDPGLNILLPSPLSGPGRPSIEREEVKQIDLAWRQLLSGQFNAARATSSVIEELPHAELLILDVSHVEKNTNLSPDFSDLAEQHPKWAAAWVSLSIVAEKEGNEIMALNAATRGAELWNKTPWVERPAKLRTRWIEDRISVAEEQLAGGQSEQALATVELALVHEENNTRAVLLKGNILVSLNRNEEAETVLGSLERDPEALFLRAQIAESNSNWMKAMNLYQLMPSDYAKRETGLARAQLNWRLSVLPRYVHQSLESPQITRAQLAIILIALAPDAEAMEGGRVPLLSDIVELPYQREILSAVRVDLINIDAIERRFYPERLASLHEIQDATVALGHLLGFTTPHWCATVPDTENVACTSMSVPISGGELADIIMGMIQETD